MSPRLTCITRLSATEQHAIALLRGSRSDRVGLRMQDEFHSLALEGRKSGLTILEPDARFLGEDEALILGCLGAFQRKRREIVVEMAPALRYRFLRCVVQLNRQGERLSYRNVSRILPRLCEKPPAPGKEPEPQELQGEIRTLAQQSRVIAFLADCGVASRKEIRALGLSHYGINTMVKRGMLIRLEHGRYSASTKALGKA